MLPTEWPLGAVQRCARAGHHGSHGLIRSTSAARSTSRAAPATCRAAPSSSALTVAARRWCERCSSRPATRPSPPAREAPRARTRDQWSGGGPERRVRGCPLRRVHSRAMRSLYACLRDSPPDFEARARTPQSNRADAERLLPPIRGQGPPASPKGSSRPSGGCRVFATWCCDALVEARR
jgi:hypothetical protein